MICPKCSLELSEIRRRAFETLQCPRCQGQWLDRVTAAGILEASDSPFATASFESALLSWAGESTSFSCPACGDSPLRVGQIEGVEIEVCGTCGGVFLDVGELQKIHRARRLTAVNAGIAVAGEATGAVVIEVILQGLAVIASALLA